MENKIKFIVPPKLDGIKAQTFLRKECNVSARMIARLKREKDGILRNGKLLKTIELLKSCDEIVLNLPTDLNEIKAVKGNVEILFEDDYILAVNKPSGVPVHPTKVHQLNTLANFLVYYAKEKGENYTFRAINRLDKDTSGIVLVCKNSYVAASLSKSVNKAYIAVCEGIINSEGTINTPIKVKEGHSVQRTVCSDGKPSITHYKPIKTGNNHTMLELTLETGRTHQIRCHMSSISHPLAGDDMYGGSLKFINRQALHCSKVELIHPITKQDISITSPVPKEFYFILNPQN